MVTHSTVKDIRLEDITQTCEQTQLFLPLSTQMGKFLQYHS